VSGARAEPIGRRPPAASLLVSTYEWPRALELVLHSVVAQRVLPAQVVVADDGSGDETAAVVRDFAARLAARGVPLAHVWHEDRGFRKSRILNRAIAAATGEYILSVDGDCVLHPDFVRSHLAFARPRSFVAGSRVLVLEARTREALARGRLDTRLLGAGLKNRQNALSLPWLSRFVRASQDPMAPTRGANVAYWRADAVRVNGYNEAFEGWGREDSEFGARLLAAGCARRKLKFGGVVYHLHHEYRATDAVDAQQRAYEATVARRLAWCERGLDQHLAAGDGGRGRTPAEVA
jgi:glycosyltransferase involved in cell wall biosynthesis